MVLFPDNAGEGESIGDLVTFANPRDDPYYQKEGGEGDADDASDAEDFRIRPTDNLIVVGHVEGDAAVLEVYVYNDVEDALYVHHDLLLPSFPMAVEWMGLERGKIPESFGFLLELLGKKLELNILKLKLKNNKTTFGTI